MWKNIGGQLIHTTDETRVRFRTNVSKSILDWLGDLADEYDTHVNYLIEAGLEALLVQGEVSYDRKRRPKDRVQYKTTYDKELLEAVRELAARNGLHINDLIELSVGMIDLDKVKKKAHRVRIEQT